MRKLIATFAVASSILLGGCATTGSPSSEAVTTAIAEVRKWTETICSFVPTAATIEAILTVGTSNYVGIAQGICDAVTARSLRRAGATRPTFNGVPIHGRFKR